jgi:hypothetical protein
MSEEALKTWIDARGLIEWLHYVRPTFSTASMSVRDRALIRNWTERGGKAQVAVVDRLLTRLELHIHLLPDELWCDPPQPKSKVG